MRFHLRPSFFTTLLLIGSVSPSCTTQAQPQVAARRGLLEGAPEISGAALLPGGRLILVSDEKHVFQIPDAQKAFEKMLSSTGGEPFQIGKAQGLEELPMADTSDDLEDAAWDRQGTLYMVASHSVNKKGKEKAKRSVIVKWPVNGATGKLGASGTEIKGLRDNLPAELKADLNRTAAKSGFNIEGATIMGDGALLLGLRSPTETVDADRSKEETNEDAILLRIDSPSQAPDKMEKLTLNLHGQGIRGLHYDEQAKGCWIVAGFSPDLPDAFAPPLWSLWFWPDGKAQAELKNVTVPASAAAPLTNAEAVCRIELGTPKKPYLLIIEDAKESSPFWLMPLPQGN